ncbi:serine/threonine-protein kinase [Thermomonospora amylolytica]|uniref:serine/threonine-protein kinase n=1 Tax=Thermomonospora amylolytica TaxID=1411117 RepID=UPI000E6CC078|nr:serine/threonine-protein kinase [Thermomonospora amylolytica]
MDGDGWRVSGFTEIRELGTGAQGRVVLARHEESGTLAAIKYLTRADGDTEAVERLRAEARMLARVSDPHVVRLYRFVTSEHGAAIVMEAVDGVSLRKVLDTHGALDPEAALLVLKGSLRGLAAAHAVGVVHRDYKPANVIVRADGLSKLVNFGVAALAGSRERSGTPAYMAPEQWAGGPASPATDVYAATCVFFECVTGHRPYRGDRTAVMRGHLHDPIPVEEVAEPLRPLVARGMAKDPAGRPPGALALAEELEAAATAAYGPDWEQRGVRMLAAGAAALAALFPLAAAGMAGAGGAAGSAGAALTGGAAAQTGLLGAAGVKVAAAALGTALVVAGGAGAAIALRQSGGAAASPPTATATTVQPVVPVAVRACPFGINPGPAASPQPVRLPRQVRLPEDAAVYEVSDPYQGVRLIGPAGGECTADGGSGVGSASVNTDAGDVYVELYSRSYACEYFPDSAQAAEARRTNPGWCPDSSEPVPDRQDVPTGLQGYQAYLAVGDQPPGSVTLRMLVPGHSSGQQTAIGPMITCALPRSRAEICIAALTYRFVEIMGRAGASQQVLDRAARQIRAYVPARLR